MVLKRMLVCCAAFVVSAGAAAAQEWYVGGSAGIALQQDSDNEGEFTSAFTPGLGADDVASGTSVGWTTDLESRFHRPIQLRRRSQSRSRSPLS
ncbi:MAG: hypothetical protein AAFQ67_09035, partial [Pseudomonadota bacterium]